MAYWVKVPAQAQNPQSAGPSPNNNETFSERVTQVKVRNFYANLKILFLGWWDQSAGKDLATGVQSLEPT